MSQLFCWCGNFETLLSFEFYLLYVKMCPNLRIKFKKWDAINVLKKQFNMLIEPKQSSSERKGKIIRKFTDNDPSKSYLRSFFIHYFYSARFICLCFWVLKAWIFVHWMLCARFRIDIWTTKFFIVIVKM